MFRYLREKITPNLSELNAYLIFVGFPVFTQIVYGQGDSGVDYGAQGSFYSIIYRAVCLTLALYLIIVNINKRHPKDNIIKWTWVLFMLMSLKLLYAFFLSPYSFHWTSSLVFLKLSFLFGVTFFPLYALYLSFVRIDWKKVIFLITLSLLFICSNTLLSATDSTQRLDLNAHQSTLAFGAYSAYLVIISVCVYSEFRKKIFKILVGGVCLVGIIGLLRAGSRGPLLSAVISIIPLFILKKGNQKIALLLITILILFGTVIYSFLESYAPLIFERFKGVLEMDESTSERFKAFNMALNQMNEHPLIGDSPLFYTKWAYGFGPHNLLLQIGMGLGYLGFLGGCILFCSYFRKAIISIKIDYISAIFSGLLIYFIIRSFTGVDIYEASDFGMVVLVLCLYTHYYSFPK